MNKSLAEQAYKAILRDILSCNFQPGSQVAQSELVEHYEFGITPVREALKRLEYEGYVRSIPRYGYLITSITMKDVEELYELRLILENAAVRQAVLNASDKQLDHIKALANFSYVFKNEETYLHFLEENTEFHHAIAMASGNQRLAFLITDTLNEMTRIFHLGLELRDSAQEMNLEHVTLADALCSRDGDKAVQISTDQILNSRKRVVEYMLKHLDFNPQGQVRHNDV
jgi:DNA-binding GntR family transcriptional regulator